MFKKSIERPNKFKTTQYKKTFKSSKNNKEKSYDELEEDKPEEKRVRILYKEVGKPPRIKIIDNTLEAKQQLVKGLIEVIPYGDDLLMVCNDEGKNLNMLPNIIFDYDYIAGDCFVIGDDYKNAGFRSLTTDEVIRARKDLIYRSFKYDAQNTSRKVDKDHGEIDL